MLADRSLPRKVYALSSRVLVPTFSVVSPVLVCSQSTTRLNSSCSARPTRVVPVKLELVEVVGRRYWGGCNGGFGGTAIMVGG
jgi:hypothetical protein